MIHYFPGFNMNNRLTNTETLRKRFTPEEDALIKKLVSHGGLSWDDIARQLIGRTGRQCRDRYNNYLNKVVIQKEWTESEDEIIIQKYKEIGSRWTQIASFLPGRNGNNVKNRWYKYIIKKGCNIPTSATMPRKKKNETNSFTNLFSDFSESNQDHSDDNTSSYEEKDIPLNDDDYDDYDFLFCNDLSSFAL